jgi:signal transduction histidine kinase
MAWPGALVEGTVSRVRQLDLDRYRRLVWPVLVVGGVALGLSFSRVHGRFDLWLALSLAFLSTAPMLLLRRRPALVLSIVVCANLVYVVIARLSWPLTGVVSWLVAMAASPLLLRRGQAVTLLVVSEIAIVAAVFVPASVNATPWDASIAEALAAFVAWGIGESRRVQRETATRRAEVIDRLRSLEERDARARDRAGMARELHDVVAHHVSLIAVRAGTARWTVPDVSVAAAAAFDELAGEARTALNELRAVLGVLRSPDGEVLHNPQPTLADLPVLLDRMRAAGSSIVLEEVGASRSLDAAVELCCYRVVQEALTNATRHAPGAAVRVTLAFSCDAITVTVCDDGGRRQASGTASAAGFGLVGMRERVTAMHGTFEAGVDDVGFTVTACIPTAWSPAHAHG